MHIRGFDALLLSDASSMLRGWNESDQRCPVLVRVSAWEAVDHRSPLSVRIRHKIVDGDQDSTTHKGNQLQQLRVDFY